jgi:hypothetical protein
VDVIDALAEARRILANLQAAVDARSVDELQALFDEPAVLIGTAGDGRDAEGLARYLDAVVQGGPFRWEWDDIVPFHNTDHEIGFAAFGEVVVGEEHLPIRVTVFAVRQADGWRMRQFHGSIPTGA